MLLLALLLSAFVFAGFYWLYFNSGYFYQVEPPARGPEKEAVGENAEKARSLAALSPEVRARLSDNRYYDSAQSRNDPELCLEILSINSRDLCFSKLAKTTGQEQLCARIISDSVRKDCLEGCSAAKALAEGDVSACALISEPMRRFDCLSGLLARGLKAEECFSIPLEFEEIILKGPEQAEFRDICLSEAYYREALLKQDAGLCRKIPVARRRGECLAAVSGIDPKSDSDRDNLDYADEIIKKTDPENPDTDGDGFLDGDEARSGYDPAGPGRTDSGLIIN